MLIVAVDSPCSHDFSPPAPYTNFKRRRCLGHVGREGHAVKVKFANQIGDRLTLTV